MGFILEHILVFAAFFFLNIEQCFCACARAEYEINKECCPMCAPGNYVYKHCTEFVSTVCAPCVNSFTSEPNGLPKCLSCGVCDSGQGLRVKTACTRTSDTVCEPLEGFYCTNHDRRSCTHAVEHTKCNPGQYIKQNGTALKDVECAECTKGTYSNGSFEICQQHTKCEDLKLVEIKPGTSKSDVECGNNMQVFINIGIIGGVCICVAVGALLLFYRSRHKKGQCARNRNRTSTTEQRMNGASSCPVLTPRTDNQHTSTMYLE